MFLDIIKMGMVLLMQEDLEEIQMSDKDIGLLKNHQL